MEQSIGFASGLECRDAQMGPTEDRGPETQKGKWEQLQPLVPKETKSMVCTGSSKQHMLFSFAFILIIKLTWVENFFQI